MQLLSNNILSSALVGALLCMPLQAIASKEPQPEVEHLLQFVGSSGCQFVRNGKEHSPEDAEDHLRLKYRNGRRYVSSAEDFIERLASESSWSGKPYQVRCPNEEPRPSRDWLNEELVAYRAKQS